MPGRRRPHLQWLVLALLVTGRAHSGSAQPALQVDELYKAAKTEGAVAFAGALKETAAEELAKAFSQRYPGIQVGYTRRATEKMVQLVDAGRRLKHPSFDLINVTEP